MSTHHAPRPSWAASLIVLALAGCEPLIDRDNPYDRENPSALCATLIVPIEGADGSARRLVVELDPIRPPGRCEAGVDQATRSGLEAPFEVADLLPGIYRVRVSAAGHRPAETRVELGPGERRVLDRLLLIDDTPPTAPSLRLTTAADVVGEASVEVHAAHDEPGVAIELERDGAPVEVVVGEGDEWPPVAIPLPGPDGSKVIAAVAIDPGGNRSSATRLTVRLDTTPPAGGVLEVAGGSPAVRGRNEVDVQVLDADTDAARYGAASALGPGCDDCRAGLACQQPIGRPSRLVLGLEEGVYCVCGVVCDAVGNTAPLAPVMITLEPFRDRPVPVVEAVEPPEKIARPDVDPWLCIVGRDLAADTVADVGDYTSLPCVDPTSPEAAGAPCLDAAADGALCLVRLPDTLRLSSDQHPVWLRTPDPVVDGVGRSLEAAQFTLRPPTPLLDRIDPMGVTADAAASGPIEVHVEGVDLTLNAMFSLAGRAPSSVERTSPTSERRAQLVLRFDLSDERPRLGDDYTLAVTNPGGDRVEVPFGIAPTIFDCPPEGRCTMTVRRTLPAGLPGHVQRVATMPADGRTWTLQTRGGRRWSLLREGAPPISIAAELGWGRLPLPGPLPGALLVAEVPAWHGGTIGLEPRNRIGRLPVNDVRVEEDPLDGPVGAALFVDLDLDGDDDMVATHPSLGRVSLIVGGQRTVFDLDGAPAALARGDLDGDGRPDLLIGDGAAGVVHVLYTGPDGLPTDRIRLRPPGDEASPVGGVRTVAVADLDADRLPEIIVGLGDGGGAGGLIAWPVRVDGRIDAPTPLDRSGAVERIIVRDHTQDTVDDLIFGGPAGIFALSGRIGGLPSVGDAERLPTDGAAWFLLTETGQNGFEWLVVPGRPGQCGLDDPDQGCVQLITGQPGAEWSPEPITVAPTEPGFVGLALVDLDADGRGELLGEQPTGDRQFTLTRSEVAIFTPPDEREPSAFHDAYDAPISGVAIEVPPFDGEAEDWQLDLTVRAVGADGRWGSIAPTGPAARDIGNERDGVDPGAPPLLRTWADIDGDGWSDHIALSDSALTADSPNPAVAGVQTLLEIDAEPPRGLARLDAPEGIRLVAATASTLHVWSGGAIAAPLAPRGGIAGLAPVGETRAAIRIAASGDVWVYDTSSGDVLDRLSTACGWAPVGATRLRTVFGAPDDLIVDRGDEPWRVHLPAMGPATCTRVGGRVEGDAALLEWLPADLDGDGAPERVEVVMLPPSDPHVRIFAGEHAVDASGQPAWRFGPERGEPILLRRVAAGHTPRTVLHVDHANADGAPDLVVGLEATRNNNQRQLWVRTLFGRAGGTLNAPAWSRPPPNGPDDRSSLALGVADTTGEGLPDVVAARGEFVSQTPLTSSHVADLTYTEAIPLVEGRAVATFDVPGGWLDRVTVLVELDAEAPLSAVVTAPRGDRVELEGPGRRSTHWWVGGADGAPVSPLRGRQPPGTWRVEVSAAADAAQAVRVSLLPSMYWERPRNGRDWDADGDGIPLSHDCDPEVPVWPAGCEP